jgi:DNA-directed RNA polymerase specialized sigma subunit
MGVTLNEDLVRALSIKGTRGGSAHSRLKAQNELINYLHNERVLEVWGRSLARYYSRKSESDVADIISVVTEGVITHIREISMETVDRVDRFGPHYWYVAKGAVVKYLDSAATTVATAMSGVSRRHRQAMSAKAEFTALYKREPSDPELIEYVNRKVAESRKDAAKQGAIVTAADIEGTYLRPYSMDFKKSSADDSNTDGDHYGKPTEDDSVRARGELAITIQQLGVQCDEMFEEQHASQVRAVLGVWMDLVMDNEIPGPSTIAARLGVEVSTVRKYLRDVDALLDSFRKNS